MKTATRHLNRCLAGLALLLGTGYVALAQLGSSSDELLSQYGKPFLESTNEIGVQSLSYRKDGFDITAFGHGGIALRVVYQKKKMTDKDVQYLLTLNRGEATWSLWAPQGAPNTDNTSTRWMRSDEMAMAILTGNELTVTAGAWNQLPEGADEAPPLPPADDAPPAPLPASVAKPSPPPVLRRKVATPEIVPARGDSRAKAIQILGRPKGGGTSGGKEVLQYDWGQVYLEHGEVVKVN